MKYYGRAVSHMLMAVALIAACPSSACGAEPAAAAAIPPRIPSDVFVAPGYMYRPLISPDGQKIAFRERLDKKVYLSIRPVESDKLTRISLPERHSMNWYRWASDSKLLISVTGIGTIYGIELPVNVLMVYDLATGQARHLGRKTQGLQGDDVLYVHPNGEYLLLALAGSVFERPGVYRINIADNQITQIVKPQSDIGGWLADEKGIVRMGFAYSNNSTKIYYRRSNDEKFELISKLREKDSDEKRAESLLDVTHIVSGKDEGYVLSNK